MTSTRTFITAAALATGLASMTMTPALASEGGVRLDSQRLDKVAADYSQYRGYGRGWRGSRGWHGGRGAAVAGAVGLGILGAAAIAASRPAYAEPVYDYGPAYGYGAYPVYDEPVVVYRPQPYYRRGYYGRGPYADMYQGAPDPARGGR